RRGRPRGSWLPGCPGRRAYYCPARWPPASRRCCSPRFLPAFLLLEVAAGDDPHVAEVVRDRGLRLVHGDLRGVCTAEGDNAVGDGGGERFDQVDALLLHHGDGDIRQVHVGDRVSEVIRSRGGGEVRPDDDVHFEVLAFILLEIVDPVVAKGLQS